MDRIEAERRAPFAKSPTVGAGGAKTQLRLLEAGLEVFGSVGFHAASIDDITQAAGCSRASFYQYFASKDELFQRMARSIGADMIEMTDRLAPIGPDADGREALHAWLSELVGHLIRFRPVIAAYVSTAQFNVETAEGAGSVAHRLSTAFADRIVTPAPPSAVLARVIGTTVTRSPALWEAWSTGIDEQRLVDGLSDLVHRSIHGRIDGVNVGSFLPMAMVLDPPSLELVADEDPEPMRERLLGAAGHVFPTLGFHATRIDDIVDRAGVAHGTFYRYFEDKNSVFEQLALLASADAARLLRAFPAEGDLAAIRGWLESWFDAYEPHLSILAAWTGAAATEPAVRDLGQGVAAEIFPALASVMSGRGFGDPAVDTIAFVAMCERVVVNVASLGTLDREPSIDTMAEVIHRGFLGRG